MLRILIFIAIILLALPYINKAKNAIFDKMPDTISLKKIGDSLNESYKGAVDKIKK